MASLTSLPPPPPALRQQVTVALLLCLLAAAAFHNSLDVPLLHDDEAAIRTNPQVRQLWPPADIRSDEQSAVTGRPVVLLSLALNHWLGELQIEADSAWKPLSSALGIGTGGFAVRGYHLVNVAVHALSAWILFCCLWQTMRLPQLAAWCRQTHAVDLAALVAAMWLVHPLQVDAVTYIIQRTQLLMGLWYLLTMYATHRAFRATRPRLWGVAAVLFCALGMLSKESMVSAPIAVVLYDRIFLFSTWREAWHSRWRLYMGLVLCWLPLLAIVSTGPRDQTVGFHLGVDWWQYGAAQLTMITHYLELVLWPVELNFDYGRVTSVGVWDAVRGAGVVGTLLGATIWSLRYRPMLGFVGAFFFFLLAPSSSIVPIVTEVGAERRMHLPLAAVLVLLLLFGNWLLSYAVHRWGQATQLKVQRLARGLGAGFVIVILTAVTTQRNEVLRSDLTIWTDTVAKAPDNCSARNNLGRAYYVRGRLAEAHAAFVSAVQLEHCEPQVFGNLGKVLIEMGDLNGAARYFEEILRDKPTFWRAYEGLGIVHLRREQWQEAVSALTRCVDNGYTNADLHTNLGMALYGSGELRAAASHMHLALQLDPDHTIARANLAFLDSLLSDAEPPIQ